jgi:hypothetical protein
MEIPCIPAWIMLFQSCEISGFDGGKYENDSLLGCSTL